MSRRRTTQAVVLIHGIGEQRPMSTLRRFVESVLEDVDDGEKYFSKPDSMSDRFELRKLQNRKQPRTHFYEYYWADKPEGTRAAHVFTWLWRLLRRTPWSIPVRMLTVWFLAWALVLSIVYVAIVVAHASGIGTAYEGENTLERVVLAAYQAISNWPLWTLVAPALLLVLQFFFISFVGDAARYLSPAPQNIRLRRSIRREGIALLLKIQESGQYQRIVLVGHSLGSVIAYDILTYLWLEYNERYDRPVATDQPALARVGEAGARLQHDGSLVDFRKCQTELWQEMRSLGSPWLITDLVTLGSPLAHAALLLADSKRQLRKKQAQREFPTCPPVPDAGDPDGDPRNIYAYRNWTPFWDPLKAPEGEVTLWTLHHAAQFACTRWTNLYFPAHLGLFGDIVGGAMKDAFGPGIKDVEVTCGRWLGLARFTIAAHVSYWWRAGGKKSLRQLKETLNLADEKVFDHLRVPPKED